MNYCRPRPHGALGVGGVARGDTVVNYFSNKLLRSHQEWAGDGGGKRGCRGDLHRGAVVFQGGAGRNYFGNKLLPPRPLMVVHESGRELKCCMARARRRGYRGGCVGAEPAVRSPGDGGRVGSPGGAWRGGGD